MIERPHKNMTWEMDDLTIEAIVEVAARPGSWKRSAYREQAEALTGPIDLEKWAEIPVAVRSRWVMHQWAGAAIAGSVRKLTITQGKGKAKEHEVTPDLVEELPDLVFTDLTVEAYRQNPHWAPATVREELDKEQGLDPNATTGSA